MEKFGLKMIWLVLFVIVACKADRWEELLSLEEHFENIDIYSEIPGSILFKSSNTTSRLSIQSKIHRIGQVDYQVNKNSPSKICNIETEIENGKINIRILPRIPPPASKTFQHNGGFPLFYSYFLTLCILVTVHGWRAAVTYGVLLSSVFAFASVCLSNLTRIYIIVEYPQTHTFRTVSVYMKNGNVTVPTQTSINSTVNCGTARSSNISGCPSCCYGHGVCGFGNQCYCDKGYDDKTYCKMKLTPRHTVFLNPVDQRVIHVQLPDKRNVTIYGKKDLNGSVRSLRSFRTNDEEGRNSNIFMGKLRKISRVVTSSGTTISFDWKTRCNVHVTVIFNKGQGQIDQDVTVCRIKQKKKQIATTTQEEENVLPSDEHANAKSSPRLRLNLLWHHLTKGDFIKIPVEIKSCNEPDSSAEVSATVVSNDDKYNVQNDYLGTLTSYPGVYHIKLPVRPVIFAGEMESSVCRSFIQSASHLCKYASANYFKFQHHICRKIRSSIHVVSGVSNAHIRDVITTCETSFQTVLSFCKEFYANIEENCNKDNIMFYDSFVPGNVTVKVAATFPGNFSVYSQPFKLLVKENVSSSVTVKRINDIRPKPRFIGFSVNPRDPRPFQRYNVSINYACASSTTKVDMRIIGSDNYHNNVTCFGVKNCNCCVLHVAGGAALVMDKVLVTLNDPLTQTVTTREIAVLF